ncbi:hypothetical protein C8R46DRAFT_1078513 [Mycena filopes]|nr:hypothetical protein C8R46DRAFT_1078513 [Mycena filopes]
MVQTRASYSRFLRPSECSPAAWSIAFIIVSWRGCGRGEPTDESVCVGAVEGAGAADTGVGAVRADSVGMSESVAADEWMLPWDSGPVDIGFSASGPVDIVFVISGRADSGSTDRGCPASQARRGPLKAVINFMISVDRGSESAGVWSAG